MAIAEPKTANELSGERTNLAADRTVMAATRTLMAWVRTALSMISFGFTIYKFLDSAVQKQGAGIHLLKEHGPRRLGLFLIALGTLAVTMGTIEYVDTIRRMNRQAGSSYKTVNFSCVMGVVIGLLGLFLFITIAIHKEVF
jgi:putative membrane protein